MEELSIDLIRAALLQFAEEILAKYYEKKEAKNEASK